MNYSNIVLLALLVHLIINNKALRNKHFSNATSAGKGYHWLLVSITAFYISDAAWGFLYEAHVIPAVFTDTVFFFILMSATVFLWTRYVVNYLQEKGRFTTGLRHAGMLYMVFVGVSLTINFFFPLIFRFDESGGYHAVIGRYIILIIQILMFMSSSVYVLMTAGKQDESTKRRHVAIGSFGMTMTAALILQVAFPLLPLYSVGCLLGSCILHTFVLEDLKEDQRLELEELFRRESEQEQELFSVKRLAYTDSLTGVKNAHAYVEAKRHIDERITNNELREFGAVVFDVNDLKQINDTKGHAAGDQLIRTACHLICRKFRHSPVFRIGGDEFVAFLEGEDYRNRKKLLYEFETTAEEHMQSGSVVVSSGLAVFRPGRDHSYRRIFERADRRMYDRKGTLKAMAV
jgi:diguanylate cyclase (GGDEF)-like protein